MGSIAEFPDLVRSAFVDTSLQPQTNLNDEGILNVRFFIRGKPWIVTIDDTILFRTDKGVQKYADEGIELKNKFVFA